MQELLGGRLDPAVVTRLQPASAGFILLRREMKIAQSCISEARLDKLTVSVKVAVVCSV